jgi:hypothetical protein
MLRDRLHLVVVMAMLLAYLAISLHNLEIVPQVYEDEPWQASTGWKLARQGVFGSDMFAGFYGMERRYYGYMPLHPLLLAGIFWIAGVGLFQARLETVLLGLLTLGLTYALAWRLFQDRRIGLLAILLLISVRSTGLGASSRSGIFFLDMSRIARYDMVVPVFGLASLHAYLAARARNPKRWSLAAGAFAGLSGLGHVYGVFWLPILALLAFWDGLELPVFAWLCLGFALPWLPYLAYVYGDLEAWHGQTRIYLGERRFDLLDPRWYLDNLLNEGQRYRLGLSETSAWARVLRAGLWSWLIGLPLSLAALVRRGLSCGDRPARAVAVPAIVFPALFALLIRIKMMNYLVAVVPLWAVAIAWGGVRLWSWPGWARSWVWARPAMILILLAVLTEGATRLAALENAARTTTPYYSYIQQVRRYIPPGARVIGLHNYWFGLEDIDYHAFAVPVYWASPNTERTPIPFDEGLNRVRPDIVLLDAHMRAYLNGPVQPGDEIPARMYSWLSRHSGQVIGRVEDSTYGLMEIYRVRY